jgi:hypothetical protein
MSVANLETEKHFVVTRHSVIAAIKRAFPNWTIHGLDQVGVQGYRWKEVCASIDEVEKYRKQGFDSFRFHLKHPAGGEAFPDYFYWEIGEEFAWRPLDKLEVHVNQGWREAYVLAVLGDEALIEYEMPRGTTAMWIISCHNPQPSCHRVVSYRACPKKWRDAIKNAGTQWEGRGQNSTSAYH